MADDIYKDDIMVDCEEDMVDGGASARHHLHEVIRDEDLYDSVPFGGGHLDFRCSSAISGYRSGGFDSDSYSRNSEVRGGTSAVCMRGGVRFRTSQSAAISVEACRETIGNMRLHSTDSNTSSQRDSAYFSRHSGDFVSFGQEEKNNNKTDSVAVEVQQRCDDNINVGGDWEHSQSYTDEDGDTHLHIAVTQRREDVVGETLSCNLPPNYVNIQDAQGRTALHLAVMTNQPELLLPLFQSKANPFARDHCGDMPLHTACYEGLFSCVRTLVALTSVLYPSASYDPNSRNYQGFTCLHLAAANGHKEIISFLVNNPLVDLNAGDGCSGRTILHHASDRGDKVMVFFLLNTYSDRLNINALAHDQRTTPLTLARGREHLDIVSVLEACGADMLTGSGLQTSESDCDSDTEIL